MTFFVFIFTKTVFGFSIRLFEVSEYERVIDNFIVQRAAIGAS